MLSELNKNVEPAQAEALRLDTVSKHFGSVQAVNKVDLSVRHGEFFSLLGPSGCGKTTLLRIVAGLEAPESGSIRIGSADVTKVPPHLRPVNTVFQSYALFPHLNVVDNVSFGLRMKKRPRKEIQERVEKVMAMMQIEALAARKPDQISGGQKQRVALARALVNEPDILLLDEPFAAIDFKLRKQLQSELLELQRRLRTTFVYVTHDQEEALMMSDRLAIMKDGRIEQIGTPEEIYDAPRTQFVAQFVGGCNVFEGTVIERIGSDMIVRTEMGEMRMRAGIHSNPGQEVVVAIRPENIEFGDRDTASSNQLLRGVIKSAAFTGPVVQYEVSVGQRIMAVTSPNARLATKATIGQTVALSFSGDSLMILEKE